MTTPRWFLAVLLLVCTAPGCGTSDRPGEDPTPGRESPPPPAGQPWGTAATHVLVKPVTALLFDALLADFGVASLGAVDGTGFFKVPLPTGRTPVGFVSELESDARVLSAELDLGLVAPEGSGLTIPAGGDLLSFQLPTQSELVRIGIDAAHARASGAGIRIAVLDSGVFFDHGFLAGRIEPGGRDFFADDEDPREERNGIDDDDNGHIDEGWGHGTFTASLVLAVAPGSTILPVRVLGTDLFGTSSAVAAAITYAANAGVQVVHLSVVVPAEVEVVREAIMGARALGVVVIGAAGNSGGEDANHPAGPDAAFLVTGVDDQDRRAPFASFGTGVALSAPGVDLRGAFPWEDPDSAIWSGTSFSAPIASGAFALVRELFPLLTPDQVLQRLRDTATDIDGLNPAEAGRLGSGRIDLDAATLP